MSKQTVFECDLCGDRFGARNDVWTVPFRRVRSGSSVFCRPSRYERHVCDCVLDRLAAETGHLDDEPLLDGLQPSMVEQHYVGVLDKGLGEIELVRVYIASERGSGRVLDPDEMADEFVTILEEIA